ncbi:uncharacterized protein LOC126264715 [Aethina tumida]|uniref:uncharacterized protein LOC126264715 n=1 Tax=Aethina tumida TaxID=116153 RepID=UPI002148A554|nr:uncharacterized protein LOC126264715 [Aethina tumida]
MVRKRNRKKYESDDNEETDSEAEIPNVGAAAPKKYSLRQRKPTSFTEDYQYDFELDADIDKICSDKDEDFEFEPKTETPNRKREAPLEIHIERNEASKYIDNVYIKPIEPDFSNLDEGELIDFEDIIKADIVVNNNMIDYENLIEKIEIKIQPPSITEKVVSPKVGKKRGRKRKCKQPTETIENGLSIFEHFLTPIMDSTINSDTCSSDDLPLATMMKKYSEAENCHQGSEIPQNSDTQINGAVNGHTGSDFLKLESVNDAYPNSGNVDDDDDDVILIEEEPKIIVLDD